MVNLLSPRAMRHKLTKEQHHPRVHLHHRFLQLRKELPIASAFAIIHLDIPFQWLCVLIIELLPLVVYLVLWNREIWVVSLKVIRWSFFARLQVFCVV